MQEEVEEEEEGRARRVAGRGLARPLPTVPAVPGARGSQVLEASTSLRYARAENRGCPQPGELQPLGYSPRRVTGRSPGAFAPRPSNRIWRYPWAWTRRSLLTVTWEGTPSYVDIPTESVADHWDVPPLFRRPRRRLPRLTIKAPSCLGVWAPFCVIQLIYTHTPGALSKRQPGFSFGP